MIPINHNILSYHIIISCYPINLSYHATKSCWLDCCDLLNRGQIQELGSLYRRNRSSHSISWCSGEIQELNCSRNSGSSNSNRSRSNSSHSSRSSNSCRSNDSSRSRGSHSSRSSNSSHSSISREIQELHSTSSGSHSRSSSSGGNSLHQRRSSSKWHVSLLCSRSSSRNRIEGSSRSRSDLGRSGVGREIQKLHSSRSYSSSD
mmetsp:Transcript_4649/g.10276  ORF Transcript_4649/g.10276 Transcript_4649/m.10276 type:complete len:204 (-) Transcript_4649:157-768(-)